MTAELGYGFGAGAGLLTPYGGLELSPGGEARRTRIGARFGRGSLALDLAAARRESASDRPEHRIGIRATASW